MTTVRDILEFIETLAPRGMKMDWTMWDCCAEAALLPSAKC